LAMAGSGNRQHLEHATQQDDKLAFESWVHAKPPALGSRPLTL
jgi:hypothetical protein